MMAPLRTSFSLLSGGEAVQCAPHAEGGLAAALRERSSVPPPRAASPRPRRATGSRCRPRPAPPRFTGGAGPLPAGRLRGAECANPPLREPALGFHAAEPRSPESELTRLPPLRRANPELLYSGLPGMRCEARGEF